MVLHRLKAGIGARAVATRTKGHIDTTVYSIYMPLARTKYNLDSLRRVLPGGQFEGVDRSSWEPSYRYCGGGAKTPTEALKPLSTLIAVLSEEYPQRVQ